MPGAQIPPSHYASFLKTLQDQSHDLSLWAAVPSFATLFDVGILPGMVKKAVERVHRKANAMGMPTDTTFIMGGHSVGAVATQEYVMGASLETRFIPRATFFLGASLLRKYNGTRHDPINKYPTPWMTLAGELDGLQRPTRVAQGYYHAVLNRKMSDEPEVDTPVVIVKGMNHMQYASDGKMPFLPKKLEIRPEITDKVAHVETATRLAAFFQYHLLDTLSTTREEARSVLTKSIQETGEFLQPILDALYQEANVYLKKPCNSDNPSPHCPYYPFWPPQPENTPPRASSDTDCWCETPWSHVAVRKMVDADEWVEVVSSDSIHDVRDTKPFHHAHIWNNCSAQIMGSTQSSAFKVQLNEGAAKRDMCKFNVTTVSESVYDRFDSLDTGFTHATAAEIRLKMKSRQLYRRNTVDPFAPYEVDNMNVCKEINELAYKWALEHASPHARARFLQYGTEMRFIEDYHFPIAIGPLWINTKLRMKERQDAASGETVLEVQSISMKTDLDSWINKLHPDSGGQHYCKLLSPARAMEWIYTDGLRQKLGYKK